MKSMDLLYFTSLFACIVGTATSFTPPSVSIPPVATTTTRATSIARIGRDRVGAAETSPSLAGSCVGGIHLPSSARCTTSTSSGSGSSSTALSALPFLDEDTTQKLILLSFEKVIDAGIPAAFFVLTTWWFLSQIRANGGGAARGRRGVKGGSGGGMMMTMMKGGGNRRGSQRGSGSRRSMDTYYDRDDFGNGGGRPLGPVEELYDDIYDDLSGSTDQQSNIPPLLKLFSGPRGGGDGGIERPTSKLNIGIPKQTFLRVTKLNSKYDSYRYSMIKATKGKAVAASELRAKGFEDALWRAIGITTATSSSSSSSSGVGEHRITDGLTPSEGTALIQLERDFLKAGADLIRQVSELTRGITNAAILMEMEEMGVEAGVLDAIVVDAEIVNATKNNATMNDMVVTVAGDSSKEEKKDKPRKIEKQSDIMRAVKEVESLNTDILLLELDFIQAVVEILGANRADAFRTTIVGNMLSGEAGMLLKSLKERPLATVLSAFNGDAMAEQHGVDGYNKYHRKNLFVTRFPGDVTASQLNELREEVTGILRSAQPGDEALLVLQSGGGTVTGYGLAAAQLQRFKARGMKLTVCVEQVAASGGYMMCCTADRIVASPFAVLGSIGVISEVPNAYERLKQEGIEFQTITAGKFKRTVTPTKKITKEDIKKSEEDIAEIFNLFKSFVKNQRPQLDIETVATGETWFGEDALAKGLCDELGTADDVLLDFVDSGYDVYEVSL